MALMECPTTYNITGLDQIAVLEWPGGYLKPPIVLSILKCNISA